MFTVADIRDIAIQVERNGEKAYRTASENITDPEIAAILSWMADEERRHARWFESIKSDKPLTDEQGKLEKMGRQLLQEMIGDQTFSLEQERLQGVRTFSEMLAQAKCFESDTILFYEFLQGVIDETDAKQQLAVIIKEERRHFEQIVEMEKAGSGVCRSLAARKND